MRIRPVLAGSAALSVGAGLVATLSALTALKISVPRRRYGSGEPPPGTYREVRFPSADQLPLAGWMLEGRPGANAVVLCHGAWTGRREMLPTAMALREEGYHTLLFDFRAHGQSHGKFLSLGYHEAKDVLGAVAFLRRHRAVRGAKIVGLGVSMGAVGLLRAAASCSDLAAVIADSAFASLEQVAKRSYFTMFRLPAFPFLTFARMMMEWWTKARMEAVAPIEVIRQIAPRPVMLIHGTSDSLVPASDAVQLYQAARDPKELWLVEGARHAKARDHDKDEYLRRVLGFLRTHLPV